MKQNKVQLVERHIIRPNDKRFAKIKDFYHLSKNLYNYANFILRQEFIANDNQIDYRALPAQTAQQTIKLLYKNYKSFFSALKNYKKVKAISLVILNCLNINLKAELVLPCLLISKYLLKKELRIIK